MDRSYPSQQTARVKRWWLFTILSVIVLVCTSCNDASQQTPSSEGATAQPLHITEGGRLPLTDAAPPQLGIPPTVLASPTQRTPTIATPTPTAPTPTAPRSYEAESSQNMLTASARVVGCPFCSGGLRVGYIGLNAGKVGTLQFHNINKSIDSNYTLMAYYVIAGKDKLTIYISVNGESAVVLNVANTANGNTIGTASITANLHAGNNTIEFSNPSAIAPDIDRIVV